MPEQNVFALLSNYSWGSLSNVTYGFPDSTADYTYSDYLTNGFTPIDPLYQQHIRLALEGAVEGSLLTGPFMSLTSVEAVTNLNLTYVGQDPAHMNIARTSGLNVSKAFFPNWSQHGGDVWYSADITNPSISHFHHWTTLHELGHALGLKHGHEAYDFSYAVLTPDRDSMEFSVMTYRTHIGDDVTFFDTNASTPTTFMMYDIAALQHLYGANFTTNSTDTVYSWDDVTGDVSVNGVKQGSSSSLTDDIFMTIWDGGGVDTYDFSNYAEGLKIDLAPGGWSVVAEYQLAYLGDGVRARGNVFNALQYNNDPRSLIENVNGGYYNDEIRGNAAANVLKGNIGNDWLYGMANDDRLLGGSGDDTMTGGAGADRLEGGEGSDTADYSDTGTTIWINMEYGQLWGENVAGDVFKSIENVFAGWGNDTLFGDAGANTLNGHFGNDTLYGGAGGDHLGGGEGDDLLIVTKDFAHLTGWGGKDLFRVVPTATGIIWDFDAGAGVRDQVQIYSSVFADYGQVLAAAVQSGSDVVVAKDSFKIVFKNLKLSALHVDDFAFL
jgi:serralysin